MCVCVRERERERDRETERQRQTDRQTDRQTETERERELIGVYGRFINVYVYALYPQATASQTALPAIT